MNQFYIFSHVSLTCKNPKCRYVYDEYEIESKIIQIIMEHNSNPYGITKTELARKIRKEKAAKRGKFASNLFLIDVKK